MRNFLGFLVLASLLVLVAPVAANAQYAAGNGAPIGIFGIAPQAPAATSVPAPASPSGEVLGASVYNFTTDLGVGSTGADVTALQQFLAAAGIYTGPVTGYFGPLTKAAVVAFQSANDVSPASGYVGPITRGVLNKGVTPSNAQEQASVLQALYGELQQALKNLAALSAST